MRAHGLVLLGAISTVWVSAIAACGGGVSQTPEKEAGTPANGSPCVPGEQIACACPYGEPSGYQVCTEDGRSFGPCLDCRAADAGPSLPDASFLDATFPPPPDAAPPPPSEGGLPNPPNLVLVHGAPGVPPFRFCWATQNGSTTSVVPIPATPDTPSIQGPPGIPVGSIQSYSPAPGATLEGITLVPFLITNLAAVANDVNYDAGEGVNLADGGLEEPCTALIGNGGSGGRLTPEVDYTALAPIPAGTIKNGGTYLVSLLGCLPGSAPDGGPNACGAAYDGGSNAHFEIVPLDTSTTVPTFAIGVQFVQASSALEGSSYVAG
ncbi:MAG TPA: hypothetical protein VGI39_25625, partial [Polyangiaceae bacterium]